MTDRYWLTGGAEAVPHLTAAALRFINEHSRLLDFSVFFLDASVKTVPASNGQSTELHMKKDHHQLLLEVMLTRTIDNTLSYVSELLGHILKARPEMLKSSEQERIDFVLRFENMDELRSALTEKRVEKLSFMGFRELASYVKSHMGFDLALEASGIDQFALIVEMRNIIVHNRGVVGNVSARRFPELASSVGSRIEHTLATMREQRHFIENAVIDMDLRAIAKFGLPAKPLPVPPAELVER